MTFIKICSFHILDLIPEICFSTREMYTFLFCRLIVMESRNFYPEALCGGISSTERPDISWVYTFTAFLIMGSVLNGLYL